MKKILPLILVLAMMASVSFAQTYHWPLDKDVTTQDIVGGKHGTASLTGVSFVDDEKRGEVMLLDGVDGFVTLPSDLLKGMDNATVTAWFNFSGGANWQRIFGFGHIEGPWSMFHISPRSGWDDGPLHVTVLGNNADPIRNWRDYTHPAIDTLVWHFVAAVFDGDNFKVYLDDVLVVSEDSMPATPNEIMVDPNEAYIGKSHWPDATFNGMIDDMKIFNTALNEAEILALGLVTIPERKMQSELSFYGNNGVIEYKGLDETQFNEVKVFGITGQLLFKSGDISTLRSQTFNNGIYIVSVSNNKETISKKVLVVE